MRASESLDDPSSAAAALPLRRVDVPQDPRLSLSQWRGEQFFRSVLLSPETGVAELETLLATLSDLVPADR